MLYHTLSILVLRKHYFVAGASAGAAAAFSLEQAFPASPFLQQALVASPPFLQQALGAGAALLNVTVLAALPPSTFALASFLQHAFPALPFLQHFF